MMNKKILTFSLIVSLVSSQISFAADIPIQQNTNDVINKNIITQEDYDRKMRSAKGLRTGGTIMAGVGGAAVIGGLAVALAGGAQNDLLGLATHVTVGIWTMVGGAAVGIPGAVMVLVGKSKQKKLKKMQIVPSPMIDPQNDTYGMSLSVNF